MAPGPGPSALCPRAAPPQGDMSSLQKGTVAAKPFCKGYLVGFYQGPLITKVG